MQLLRKGIVLISPANGSSDQEITTATTDAATPDASDEGPKSFLFQLVYNWTPAGSLCSHVSAADTVITAAKLQPQQSLRQSRSHSDYCGEAAAAVE